MNGLFAAVVIGLLGLATVQACYYGGCNSGCYVCGYQNYQPSYYRGNGGGGGGGSSSSAAASSSSSNYGWGGGSSSSAASSSSSGGNNGYWGGGFYSDVNVADAAAIKDEKTACQAFMELSTDKKVLPKEMGMFIENHFYKTAEMKKENANGLKPSTFHCCMMKFGNAIYKGAHETYTAPVLPKDATCSKLTGALLKDLTAKKE